MKATVSKDPASHPALLVEGLEFSYTGGEKVLGGLDAEIGYGERVGLIGPNGAGKTTFFLVVCGVLKATAGEVRLLGEPVSNGRFNPDVGMVFQKPDDQLFCPSVSEDVAFGPRNMGLPPDEIERRVTAAMAVTGVTGLAERPVHHLSEGEKRLVTIAGVLAMRSVMILYDEPSAGLDIRSRRRLISLLQKSEETLLIASHDHELILEVCGRVILLDRGKILADGDPRRVMADEALMEAHGQEKPHSLVPHNVRHSHSALGRNGSRRRSRRNECGGA